MNDRMTLLNKNIARVAQLKAAISAMRIKHARNIMKIKIRERGKRVLAAMPVVGLVAVGWFEKQEYDEWKQQYPHGDLQQYSQQVGRLVAEVADEYYEEIKKEIPSTYSLKNKEAELPPRITQRKTNHTP